jgi:predicted nucleotidyltransferase
MSTVKAVPAEIQADPAIAEIVRRLVEAVDPDKLILFGSRAAGRPSEPGDYDILIVKDSPLSPYQRLKPAYAALWRVGVPVDLLWYAPAELDYWAGVSMHVATQASRNGVVIYARNSA